MAHSSLSQPAPAPEQAADPAPWRRPLPEDEHLAEQARVLRERKLLLDPRPPGEMMDMVMAQAKRFSPRFLIAFAVFGLATLTLGVVWLYQMSVGLGITGLNRPVMWAPYITSMVYFIGIGHAGTFISAAFRALRIPWRAPISRFAELLTVFGLATAALFPLIHVGRSWKAFYLIPAPHWRMIWPSTHSPLVWDLVAITTYLTCSALFVYLGLVPDLAAARDRTDGPRWRKRLYEIASVGWRGTERQWSILESAQNVFTYAIIPVMFSVHTIVSWDFAMALQPGWHSTIFGPYFVVGALFSGVAAVIIIMAVIRKTMHLEYFLRAEHFNGMGMLLLILSFTWAYFYFNDYLVPWYGQGPAEKVLFQSFIRGPRWWLWWTMMLGNILLPWLILWNRKWRTNIAMVVGVSIFVNIGMYIERVLIVAISLGYNELPYSWGIYIPRLPEILIIIGAFSLVIFLYIIFSRLFPLIPVWEVAEGQLLQRMRPLGREMIETRIEH